MAYAYCNLSFEHIFELKGDEVVPQGIDNMTTEINSLDPNRLQVAWKLSRKAVRSRLNGERDLTIRELAEVSKILGTRTSDLLA